MTKGKSLLCTEHSCFEAQVLKGPTEQSVQFMAPSTPSFHHNFLVKCLAKKVSVLAKVFLQFSLESTNMLCPRGFPMTVSRLFHVRFSWHLCWISVRVARFLGRLSRRAVRFIHDIFFIEKLSNHTFAVELNSFTKLFHVHGWLPLAADRLTWTWKDSCYAKLRSRALFKCDEQTFPLS